ncbi:MAG TPA: PEP-utilizing enzyme [Ilumatobacteraceae bacterium]|nr:PEP-utilizing enzyme [Ilumatobacteraceae bacterium]
MSTHWIVEGRIDPRWPINTRGNIGEVFPEVLTPLTYKLAVIPAEQGWRDAFRRMGILAPNDLGSTEPTIIGLYGGYGYLNLSYLRIVGVRAPGSNPTAIDVSLFGEGNPPPYAAHKGDKNVWCSAKMLRTVLSALSIKDLPAHVADSRRRADEWTARRPALSASSDDLLTYLQEYPQVFAAAFENHMITTFTASIVGGLLGDGATAAGDPTLVTDLMGAYGEVASAQYARQMWVVAKLVRDNPVVGAEFDRGVDGLLSRLDSVSDATEFRTAFAAFITEYGHRGPNDWEISSRTWENTPELALTAIDRMRLAEHDLDPPSRTDTVEQLRRDAVAKVLPHLNVVDKVNFKKAVNVMGYWFRGREGTRDQAIRMHLPTRQVYFELAGRIVEGGGCDDPRDVALLDPFDELPKCLAEPSAWSSTIRERAELRDRFAAVEPPFFINSQVEIPGIEEMEAVKTKPLEKAAVGTVLRGASGCSGVARGRARVVLDPGDANGLEPGDVLVAPLTDPAWTPLFLPAAAVVVNVGALMSHAIIVSRELGIPCAVSVAGATERIADGDMIEVDGSAGTVTILRR